MSEIGVGRVRPCCKQKNGMKLVTWNITLHSTGPDWPIKSSHQSCSTEYILRSSHQNRFIKTFFLIFRNIYRKTLVLEFLFNTVADLRQSHHQLQDALDVGSTTQAHLFKSTVLFKNTYFDEHLLMAASDDLKMPWKTLWQRALPVKLLVSFIVDVFIEFGNIFRTFN